MAKKYLDYTGLQRFTSKIFGKFDTVNSNLVVVTGILASGVNNYSIASYPLGFTIDNCAVVSEMYYLDNAWNTPYSGAISTTLRSDNINVYTRATTVNGLPFRILLRKHK